MESQQQTTGNEEAIVILTMEHNNMVHKTIEHGIIAESESLHEGWLTNVAYLENLGVRRGSDS